ncbi:MAG: DUF6259 domain-containing protein [Candidatus Helarchaeota archaeon]
MENAWFALYHVYSTKKAYDERALRHFEEDIKFAQNLDVKTLILEDYYTDFLWGEYTNFWDAETFQKMVQITHDYGMRFIPYTDATELAIHGEIYAKNGKKWAAKNPWGKVLSAFSSIFLPYYSTFNFHTKLMCPASGWGDYFTNQAHILLNQFEVDGIYIDRLDYRVRCYDHFQNPEHFTNGIPNLVKRIQEEVKASSTKNLLIVNDSCVDPDYTLKQCLQSVDYVLTELLPVDTDPYNFYWQFIVNWGEILWALRYILKPLIKFFMKFALTSRSMTDETRIQQIINRLKLYVGKNIFVFSHRRDYEGISTIRRLAEENQLACCFISGLDYLRNLKNLFEWKK